MNKKLVLVVTLMAFVIAGTLLLIRAGKNNSVMTGAQFSISPTDATIRISGEIVSLNKEKAVALEPGNYEVEIIRLDFISSKVSFSVRQSEVTEVPFLLSPANESGEAFLLDELEQRTREEIGYKLSSLNSSKLYDKNPIVSILPAYNSEFRIDYGISQKTPDDPASIAIYITTDVASQRQAALDWIRGKNYIPEDLEIYYRFYDQ